MTCRRTLCEIVLAAACLGPAARAQIVNVQPSVNQETDEGLSGELRGALSLQNGNRRLQDLSAGGQARYRAGDHTLTLMGGARYALLDHAAFVNQTFEHLRYRFQALEWLAIEVFAQHELNEFRRLTLRALAGAGPRLTLLRQGGLELSAGTAYLLEHERLSDDGQPDAGATYLNHRWSSYLHLTLAAAPGLQLGYTTYLQPRLDDPRDLRLLSQASLNAKGTDWLGVRLGFSVAYDSRPPAAVQAVDTALESALVLSF